MHDKTQSAATGKDQDTSSRIRDNRFDCKTELGRRRWIRVARSGLTDEQFVGWKAKFELRYPPVPLVRAGSPTLPERAGSPPPEAESHIRLSSSGVSVIDGVEFMDDNKVREQARKAAGPFLKEIHDSPTRAWVRFKRWNHRVELAYADIRRKLQRPPE